MDRLETNALQVWQENSAVFTFQYGQIRNLCITIIKKKG